MWQYLRIYEKLILFNSCCTSDTLQFSSGLFEVGVKFTSSEPFYFVDYIVNILIRHIRWSCPSCMDRGKLSRLHYVPTILPFCNRHCSITERGFTQLVSTRSMIRFMSWSYASNLAPTPHRPCMTQACRPCASARFIHGPYQKLPGKLIKTRRHKGWESPCLYSSDMQLPVSSMAG